MNTSKSEAAAQPQVDNARDLLVRLYRDIGISAVAAALEASRTAAAQAKAEPAHEVPAILRDHDLAA
jgi:hypothetical protein